MSDNKIPPFIENQWHNCQAQHSLVEKIVNEQYLEDSGDDVHRAGLYLTSTFRYAIDKVAKTEEEKQQYKDYYRKFFAKYRYRDATTHFWDKGLPVVPSCEIWDRDFGLCDGCPFKGKIPNPKELWYGKPLRPNKIEQLDACTNEQIRKTTFKQVRKKVIDAVTSAKKLDLLIASPQGSGKSELVDKLAAELAKNHKTVLIAVPTGQLAIDHKTRLEKYGVKPFVVMGHANLFKFLQLPFACPAAAAIEEMQNLGVNSSEINRKYCQKCEFKDSCPYPSQYKSATESASNVVIIQHAHFRLEQPMSMLLQKHFDVLFVDETFVESVYSYLKPSEAEIDLLKKYRRKYRWIERLLDWFKGEAAAGHIPATGKQLKAMKETFDYHNLPWNIREYLSAYNDGSRFNPTTGTFTFTPIPDISVRVFTDATPPVEMLKTILDSKKLQVIGDKQLLNVKAYNPENEIIKVIDASNSKRALSDWQYYQNILRFIGNMARTEYKDLSILVTVYMDDVQKVQEYFKNNFPNEAAKIKIGQMVKGVNEYQETNVQFVLAGVHLNPEQAPKDAWKLKNIVNFWAAFKRKTRLKMIFPYLAALATPESPYP